MRRNLWVGAVADMPVLWRTGSCLALLAALLTSSSAEGGTITQSTSAETGWDVYQLSQGDTVATIVPAAGANVKSITHRGAEYLHQPNKLADLPGVGHGVPILYPTPNRIRGAKFAFDGRTYEFPPNGRGNHLHGLVHSEAFEVESTLSGPDFAQLTCRLDFKPGTRRFELFPWSHTFRVQVTVRTGTVRWDYFVENNEAERPLPFGVGLHPYILYQKSRQHTYLQVPATHAMEADRQLPSGKLLTLDNHPLDARKPRSLKGFNADDVFAGLQPNRPARLEFRDVGRSMVFRGSPEFSHLVVWTPERPYLSVENQTCSTDAHNLHAAGHQDAAGLQICPPNERRTGHVEYTFADRPEPSKPAGPFAKTVDQPGLPRVLLLGDSISIGYTSWVRDMLRGQANVHRAPTNCGPTSRGLSQIDQWLGDKPWDVIHFNFGLHDLKYIDAKGRRVPPADGTVQIPPKQYQQNLAKLLDRLQQTGAKLIWCSTTPVPKGAHGRNPGDAKIYNALAQEVLDRDQYSKIAKNDLYEFANARLAEIQQRADVHFTPEGSRKLAMHVCQHVRSALKLPYPTPSVCRGVVYEDHDYDGQFSDGDTPLSEVRVSNGHDIVTTDSEGRYEIPVTDDDIIFVIKPRGYRTPLNAWQLPQFYYVHKPNGSPHTRFPGVRPTGALPDQVNFPLYAQAEPEQFKALMFGDPQPRNQTEIDYMAHDVIEELVGTDASFGVTLGDIVFDDLSLFESQAKTIALLGIPWYNVIGNHDINYDSQHDQFSDESFERVFGPAYYSFDYGPVHFVVLDDVEWYIDSKDGKGKYRGGLGKQQIEFVKRDLAAIPPHQLVVLMMHIPLNDIHDRQGLYRLIEKRPFCMSISAHRHQHQHRMIGPEDGLMTAEPHHHVVNVTVSGSWWAGQKDERGIPHAIMGDGAPNGYSTLSFNGNQYQMDFKAAGRDASHQMTIHAPEVLKRSADASSTMFVNFFNGGADTRVEFRIGDAGAWTVMDKTEEADPFYQQIYAAEQRILTEFERAGKPAPFRKLNGERPSMHLWRHKLPAQLSIGTHRVRVRVTDRHGRVYHGSRVLRVEK